LPLCGGMMRALDRGLERPIEGMESVLRWRGAFARGRCFKSGAECKRSG
jgi:hypothetical protein